MRYLLLVNSLLLAVIGTLYFLFAARPGGLIVAAVVWAVAALLVGCLPLTNPHRHEEDSRW